MQDYVSLPTSTICVSGRGGSTIGEGDEVLQKDSLYIFFRFGLNNVNISAEAVKIQLEV